MKKFQKDPRAAAAWMILSTLTGPSWTGLISSKLFRHSCKIKNCKSMTVKFSDKRIQSSTHRYHGAQILIH